MVFRFGVNNWGYNISNLDTIVSDSKLSDSILFKLSKHIKVIKP
ncbi:lactose phosphotransferase system repressor [Streptococcus pneumoniae]|nr:lactose phosphotransferase system repressor [Streptococcus pneumoniae]